MMEEETVGMSTLPGRIAMCFKRDVLIIRARRGFLGLSKFQKERIAMKRVRVNLLVHYVMLLTITGLLMTVVSLSWAASNLNLSKSNINRVGAVGAKIVSASALLSGPNQTALVFAAPATGEFVVTQFCASPANGGIRLAASGLGPIAHMGGAMCYTFNPGVIVDKSSEITCSTTDFADPGDYFCSITGLLAD
jgi:hypothetical protein